MSLKSRITDDMKNALRAKDTARLSTIRLLLAAIKQREIDERKDMTDPDVLAIIDKMVKQRKDSIAQFDAGNRRDLADAEIDAAIVAALAAAGAGGPSAMGKVMATLKSQLAGRADFSAISAKVKAKLSA